MWEIHMKSKCQKKNYFQAILLEIVILEKKICERVGLHNKSTNLHSETNINMQNNSLFTFF